MASRSARPEGNTIVAGRTGKIDLSGRIEITSFPASIDKVDDW